MVGQDHEVERRQLADGQRRLGQPLRGQAHAQVGPIVAVQEVGIGEDGEARGLAARRARANPLPRVRA
jgi:hypothetical protein